MSEPTSQSPVHAQAQPQSESLGQEGGVSMSPPAFQLKAGAAQPFQKQSGPAAPQAIQRMTPEEEELTGQFDPAKHQDFVRAQAPTAEGKEFRLRKEATVAFNMMQQAASSAGIALTLVSATRNYKDQKGIWDKKWDRADFAGKKAGKERSESIMEYSSMPGSSRHHWGTDADFNSTEPKDWLDPDLSSKDKVLKAGGRYNKAYIWLRKNAASFGWGQTYDAKGTAAGNRGKGYNEERWHWSYIPLAAGFQASYVKNITNEELATLDFKGASSAPDVGVVNDYVNSVAADTMSATGYGRPKAIATLRVSSATLPVYYDPKVGKTKAITLKKGDERVYYQEITIGKVVWRLVDEGWLKHSETTGKDKDEKTTENTELVAATAPETSGTTSAPATAPASQPTEAK